MKEKLITEVEKHPCLYEKKSKDNCNQLEIEKAWGLIAAAVGEDRELCQTQWKTLLDRYVEECTKYLPSGSAVDEVPEFCYLEQMAFLSAHVKPLQGLNNCEFREDDLVSEPTFYLSENEDIGSETLTSSSQSSSAQSRKKRYKRDNVVDNGIAQLNKVLVAANELLQMKKSESLNEVQSRNDSYYKVLESYMRKCLKKTKTM